MAKTKKRPFRRITLRGAKKAERVIIQLPPFGAARITVVDAHSRVACMTLDEKQAGRAMLRFAGQLGAE